LKKYMIAAIQRQEDQTITLTVTIPWAEVKKVRDAIVADYTKSAELPGFRKGKAPKKLVEEKVDEEKVREETLKKLLPQFYLQAINEQKINPVIAPRIHVEKLEEGKDWQFIAVTCEAPEIKLGTYKEAVKKITAKSKIIIPGKKPVEVGFDDIVKEILASVEIKIPKIIIEQEVERLLSQTLDEVKKLGLTLDQYLGSTGRKAEDLRKEYELKAENDIKLEFILQKIAEEEKITVENKEVEEAIQQAKSEAERQNLEANRYLLASILRQQKTLDFLKNL
jgi:FKBP-type peptidyl-prolyl cis-trans isomerase (trigger factor)